MHNFSQTSRSHLNEKVSNDVAVLCTNPIGSCNEGVNGGAKGVKYEILKLTFTSLGSGFVFSNSSFQCTLRLKAAR